MGNSRRKVEKYMVIYRLMHSYAGTETIYGDEFALGCYSDLDIIKKTIDIYRTIEGFSQFPNGFYVFEYTVNGESDCGNEFVYVAEVYIHDEDYDFERVNCLGVFGNNADAEQCISNFQNQNEGFINSTDLVVECTAEKYKIDEMGWKEGFNFA